MNKLDNIDSLFKNKSKKICNTELYTQSNEEELL